jgi:hypothetical protein
VSAFDSTESFLDIVTQQSSPMRNVTADTLTEVASSPTLLPVPNLVRSQGVAALFNPNSD